MEWVKFHQVWKGTLALQCVNSTPMDAFIKLMTASIGLERLACPWPTERHGGLSCKGCATRLSPEKPYGA
jgi:hypothetical protein